MNLMQRTREAVFGRGDWMETYTGGKYYPASPHAEDVRITDIAHHLSMICRFTGACRRFYSVAEHSVLVSQCVPPEFALTGLLHDATEAYTNDMGRPLKRARLMWGYRRIEARNWRAITERFDLPRVLPFKVHYADNAVLLTERSALMYPTGREWNINVIPARVRINCWEPEVAEKMFLDRFYELTRGHGYKRRVAADAPHWGDVMLAGMVA